MDRGGLWTTTFGAPATSVTAEGTKVVIVFSGNAAAKHDAIIAANILPEHIYATVGDPTKYVDKSPVSTGPYKVGSYNGRRLVLERRADYRQPDKIKVKEIVQEGTYDAATAAMTLKAGQLDAYWGDIPNPQKTFVDANPKINHFWYAPNGQTALSGNTQKAPFNDTKLRKAISYAMNKNDISRKATFGIMKPASQTGPKLPSMESYVPAAYAGKDTAMPFDVKTANSLLDAAGYKKNADGKRTNPNGSPRAVTFMVQAGWIDYQAMAGVVVKGLNDAGIDATAVASAPDSVDAAKKSGDHQVVLEYVHGGCEFVKRLGAKLVSNQIPTAKDLLPNVERWKRSADDAAVAALSDSTTNDQRTTYVAVAPCALRRVLLQRGEPAGPRSCAPDSRGARRRAAPRRGCSAAPGGTPRVRRIAPLPGSVARARPGGACESASGRLPRAACQADDPGVAALLPVRCRRRLG